jgi:hypothetical protein
LLVTMLGWHWIGAYVQPLFFMGYLLLVLVAFGAIFMLGSAYLMRVTRRREPERPPDEGDHDQDSDR